MRIGRWAALALVGLGLAASAGEAFALVADPNGKVLQTPDGKPVFRYMTSKPADSKLTANSLCCFHPVYTPSGKEVTALAPDDHRHHRGAFLAWYALRGPKDADFWGWGQFAPTKDRVIENRSLELAAADAQKAELATRNDWLAEGEALLHEELHVVTHCRDAVYVIDLAYHLTPTADLKLDQSAFAGFCVRFRKDGTLQPYLQVPSSYRGISLDIGELIQQKQVAHQESRYK